MPDLIKEVIVVGVKLACFYGVVYVAGRVVWPSIAQQQQQQHWKDKIKFKAKG